jgi:hypothetical protein
VYLNVGAWLSVIHCFGFALSVWLSVYGFIHARKWSVVVSFLLGVAAFVFGLAVCYVMFRLMKRGIETRTPEEKQWA